MASAGRIVWQKPDKQQGPFAKRIYYSRPKLTVHALQLSRFSWFQHAPLIVDRAGQRLLEKIEIKGWEVSLSELLFMFCLPSTSSGDVPFFC